MGVISSCLSHCISIYYKKKKTKENSLLLLEVIPSLQKKITENEKIQKKSELQIQRISIKNKKDSEDENIILFFTPKQSLKNKNVKFSMTKEEENIFLNNSMLPEHREKSTKRSIASNKSSMEFYSCKESESKRESFSKEEVMNGIANNFYFESSRLKNISKYQNFKKKFHAENLELINITPSLNSQINLQTSINLQLILSESDEIFKNKSLFKIFEETAYECKFFLGSELIFDDSRILTITGEFCLYSQAEDFLYFINEEVILKELFNFETQILLAYENENARIYFVNIPKLYGNMGCNFFFYKNFFHNEQNLCEISFSLSQEEINQELKKDKLFENYKNFEMGNIMSGIIIKPEELDTISGNSYTKPKIRVFMYYKINYKQNVAISFAKYMFSNQIKLFFEKLKKKFHM